MKSIFKSLGILLLILLVMGGIFIALLPTLSSTDWGRKQIVNWVNYSIPGQIEISSLDLHWGKNQVIEGFLLKDPEGKSVVEIEKFSTEATLWRLLSKSTRLGFTQIQDLNAAIVTDDKGWTNLQKALGVSPSAEALPITPSTIILSDVNADIYLFAHQHPLSADIKGLTKQDNLSGSFEINVALQGLQGENWQQLKTGAQHYLSVEGSKEAKIHARVTNFPVDLIDRLVALRNPDLNGLFHSLLGDRLNLVIDKEPSREGLAFNLTALAPLMQGDIKGKVSKGHFTLQEPAIFHFNLTPESVNPFTSHHFELLQASRLKMVIQEMMLPLTFLDNEVPIDSCQFGFKIQGSLPKTAVDVYSLGNLNLLTLQLTLEAPLCDPSMRLQIVGQAQGRQDPFDIHFESTLTKPTHLSDLLQQVQRGMQSSLKVTHFPLQLLPFVQKQPELIEQIGDYASAQVVIKAKEIGEYDLTASLQAPHLVLPQAQFHMNKDLTLTSPANFNWQMPASCLQSLLKMESLSLEHVCPVLISFKHLVVSFDAPESTKFHIELTIPEIQLPYLLPGGKLRFKDVNFRLDSPNSTDFYSQLNAQAALVTSDGLYSPLLDHPLELVHISNWKRLSQNKIEMPFGRLQLNSLASSAQIEGRLSADRHFILTKPAYVHYLMTPLALQTISQLLEKEWPKLQQATNVNFTIEPTSLDLTSAPLAFLKAKGLLALDRLALQDTSGALPTLENLFLPWTIDAPRNHLLVNLKGQAYTQEGIKPSQLSARIQLENWLNQNRFDISHVKAEIQADLTNLPTSVVSVLLTTHDLSPIIGPVMDIDLQTLIDRDQHSPGFWDMDVDSSSFHAKARFKFTDVITLYDAAKPAEFRFTVTPESYSHLKTWMNLPSESSLAEPATLSGHISQLNVPMKKSPSLQDLGQLVVDFTTTDIKWMNTDTPPIHFEGDINSQNLAESIHFSCRALAASFPPLRFEGSLTDLFNSKSKWNNWTDMSLQTKLQAQQLTPTFLQSLLLLNTENRQKIQALFGETIDIQASCHLKRLNGPVKATVKGSLGNIQLDGQVQQGILTLNSPLTSSVQMTPLFTQTFFAANAPLLSSAIGSEQPIRLEIDPTRFSCSLFPFQLERVNIDKGTLSLGKIRFRNEGELRSILNMIRPIPEQQFTIWFTPLYFQLHQGKLTLKRLDMLVANAYTLASWGTLNLLNQKADLTLGISAQSLQYAFGIQGLDEDYLLQIPLYTRQGKVEVDKTKAAARISALVAQTKGGDRVKFVGDLIDLALTNSERGHPAPTTHPFPWAQEFTPAAAPKNEAPAEAPAEESSKKKRKRQKSLGSEEIIKGASQLFDQLLKQ